ELCAVDPCAVELCADVAPVVELDVDPDAPPAPPPPPVPMPPKSCAASPVPQATMPPTTTKRSACRTMDRRRITLPSSTVSMLRRRENIRAREYGRRVCQSFGAPQPIRHFEAAARHLARHCWWSPYLLLCVGSGPQRPSHARWVPSHARMH